MPQSPQYVILYMQHKECLNHLTKSDHGWVMPDLFDSIMSVMKDQTGLEPLMGAEKDSNFLRPYKITISNRFNRMVLVLMRQTHSVKYLTFVSDLSKELERKRKHHMVL